MRRGRAAGVPRGATRRRTPQAPRRWAVLALFAASPFFAADACRASDDGWSGIVPLPVEEGRTSAEEGPPSCALEFLGALDLPENAPEGLSGVAWLGGAFAFVEDSGGRVHFADLMRDRATGIPTGCVFRAAATVRGAVDLEGIAFDGARGALWVSDESGPSVFRVATGIVPEAPEIAPEREPEREALPPSLSRCRPNLALEALTFDPDRDVLFTASEAEWEGGPPGFSRLVSISPRQPDEAGRCRKRAPVREWLAPLEPATGAALPMLPPPFTGLCGLAALPDGRLLALERTFGYEFAPGADGEPVQSLCRATVSLLDLDVDRGADPGTPPVAGKRVLWRALTGDANFEGICLGPDLPDGGRLVVLVSDGDVSRRRGMEMRWRKSLLFLRLR